MFHSLEEIVKSAHHLELPVWKVIQKEDADEEGITADESFARMMKMYQAMKESVTDYEPDARSSSGMAGGNAGLVHQRLREGKMISGDFIGKVMEAALAAAEGNACMKRIVAAPTAGSCGVLPAVLLSIQKKEHFSDEQMAQALYVSVGIGGVIARKASLAGASGGCQAEIGSASGMAAGALVFLMGGTPEQIMDACAIAIKGLLGLVCDPVAGLVEVPCVKRNVIGAVNAVTSADMALAGVKSVIPPDEVIEAMKTVGNAMPESLRETGKGGLAATKTGIAIAEMLRKKSD